MRIRIIFSLIFTVIIHFSGFVFSQNLVTNYNFSVSRKEKGINKAQNWDSKYTLTNIYLMCNIHNCNNYHTYTKSGRTITPEIKPYLGSGFAGLITYSNNNSRGYLCCKLKQNPVKGIKYKLSLFVAPSKKTNIFLKNITVFLSSDKPSFLFNEKVISSNITDSLNYIINLTNSGFTYLNKKAKWNLVECEFYAKGSEKYITIGNFLPNSKFNQLYLIEKNISDSIGYYYIDNVRLVENKSINAHLTEKNQPVTLKNIFFQTGKATLLPKSFVELNRLVILLKDDSKIVIQINGHTDNTGNKEINIELSKNRAKSTVNYLHSKGISSKRLKYKGFGSSKPKADNSTTKGRAENRRVEFVILEK